MYVWIVLSKRGMKNLQMRWIFKFYWSTQNLQTERLLIRKILTWIVGYSISPLIAFGSILVYPTSVAFNFKSYFLHAPLTKIWSQLFLLCLILNARIGGLGLRQEMLWKKNALGAYMTWNGYAGKSHPIGINYFVSGKFGTHKMWAGLKFLFTQ